MLNQKKSFSKLRFKKYSNEIYNSITIEDCFDVINSLTGLNKNNFLDGNELFIPYLSIIKKWYCDDSLLMKVNINHSKQNIIKKYDILVTNSSETSKEIGYNSIFIGSKLVYLNSFSFCLRLKKPVIILFN